jgi:hypothetical protein
MLRDLRASCRNKIYTNGRVNDSYTIDFRCMTFYIGYSFCRNQTTPPPLDRGVQIFATVSSQVESCGAHSFSYGFINSLLKKIILLYSLLCKICEFKGTLHPFDTHLFFPPRSLFVKIQNKKSCEPSGPRLLSPVVCILRAVCRYSQYTVFQEYRHSSLAILKNLKK